MVTTIKKKLAILFGIILVIALCAGISTHSAYAANIVASGYCGGDGDGTNLAWTLDSEGKLTISGDGAMADYSIPLNVPWCGLVNDITSITISEGVTNIGENAFSGCKNLTSITIPDSVLSIGGDAFLGCSTG